MLTLKEHIAIGVADSNLKKEGINSKIPNAIYYYGDGGVGGDGKGTIWESGKKIKEGNTVTVSVDLERGKIEWAINGATQFSYSMQRLKDKNINWVPYLWMTREGDCL